MVAGGTYRFDPKKFYRKGKLYIEKPKHRIETIGELKGITFKGLEALRTGKKKKKKLYNWRS